MDKSPAAVIDLGTNTWNLLIGRQTESGLERIFSAKIPVKLGKNGIQKGVISLEAFQRALEAIETHSKTLKEYNIDPKRVHAFATSAIRSTQNGSDLVERIFEQFGIHVQVIDGIREAELIFRGVREAIPLDSNTHLICDIGGGSTEFILAKGEHILYKTSTLLGVSRLAERFTPSDPLSELDQKIIQIHFETALMELEEQIALYPLGTLIGSSGSFESFAAMLLAENKGEALQTHYKSMPFATEKLLALLKRLVKSDYIERLQWPGLIEMRADTIHLAALQVLFIIERFKPESVFLSQYALKEGALANIYRFEK